MSIDPNDLLLGGGIPAAKFQAVGDMVKGTVVRSESAQMTDFKSRKPLFWDDGRPQMQVIVTLQTDERDPSINDDDGQRKVYVPIGKQIHRALSDALRAAGAKLEMGGTLAVKYIGDKPSETPGFNAAKQYQAQYQPPSATAANDLLAGAAAGSAPAAGVPADDLF